MILLAVFSFLCSEMFIVNIITNCNAVSLIFIITKLWDFETNLMIQSIGKVIVCAIITQLCNFVVAVIVNIQQRV